MANYDAQIRVKTVVETKELKEAQREFKRTEGNVQRLYKKGEKLEALGVDKQSKQWQSLRYDTAQAEIEFENAKETLNELQKTGFQKAEKSAKKLGSTMKVLRNIVLSMVAFQVIAKGAEYIAEGFKNLVQHSAELNGVFSDLKSETATLKNSLATAFSPIVAQIVPYLTTLVSWLNTAMNAMSQFWAVLGGKNTYTRAKKQVIDYANSVKDASKTAKNALASFDELNVLNKSESAGGGEVSGAEAFEEVAIEDEFVSALEKAKEILELIAPVAILIGAAFKAWKIADLLSSLMLAHPLLGTIAAWLILIAGTALAVYNYIAMWKDGVDWKGIIGYVAGVTLAATALYMLFGPLVAGIALIGAGVAGLILAIKDIIENGMNAQNMALLLIACVGVLTGVFLAFGSTATLIVGAVMAVIGVLAALVAYGGNGAEALGHLKDTFKSLGDFVSNVFTGDMESAFESLKNAGRSFGNFFISVAEGIANGFIKMVNAAIDAINTLSFNVPEWLQGITGMQTFGFNIPHWDANVKLPRLATGGIVTSSTLANIGEAGREAVLPLENHTEWMDELADRIGASRGPVVIKFSGSLAELGRVLKPVIENEDARVGNTLVVQ